MGIEVGTAVLIAAALSAGGAVYQSEQQRSIAEADKKRREEAARVQKENADRIAADTRPEGETVKEIKFGTDTSTDTVGSADDFLIPKTSALGTSSARSGLGFQV